MKKTTRQIRIILAALTVSSVMTGCSTLESAYQSTTNTVSGWFKSGDKKLQQ